MKWVGRLGCCRANHNASAAGTHRLGGLRHCGSYGAPQCSIEEIRGMVSFPVFALPNLPEGMHFTGATGGPDRVVLSYNTPDQTGFIDLVEEPFTDPQNQLSWVVGADAEIQQVKIGAVMGEYVKGSYDGSSNPPVWNPNIGLQQMRWVNRGPVHPVTPRVAARPGPRWSGRSG